MKLSEKYPQCTAAYEADEDEAWIQLQLQHEADVMTREENFKRELLNTKLDGLNKLAESISALAGSLKDAVRPQTVNVYLTVGKDVPAGQVRDIIKVLETPL